MRNAENFKFTGVENFNVVSFELCLGWQLVPMARCRRGPGLAARGTLVMDHQGDQQATGSLLTNQDCFGV